MLKDGYKEGDAIPIATKQAEEWYKDASKEELEELKHKHITQHQKIHQHDLNLMMKMFMYIMKIMNGKSKQKMQNKRLIHLVLKRSKTTC